MIRKSTLLTATLALAAGLAAASAQARDVTWSIGIHAPLQPGVSIGTVISNAPAYWPAPVIYAEPVYMPAPVFVRPAPVVYLPQPVYAAQRVVYAPRGVVYAPGWVSPGRGHRHWQAQYRQRGKPVLMQHRR